MADTENGVDYPAEVSHLRELLKAEKERAHRWAIVAGHLAVRVLRHRHPAPDLGQVQSDPDLLCTDGCPDCDALRGWLDLANEEAAE